MDKGIDVMLHVYCVAGACTNLINGSATCGVLIGVSVKNEKEAYELYNEYARKIGFSVRRGIQRRREGSGDIRAKRYYCSKEGEKSDSNKLGKLYSKINTRTGCKAMVEFTVSKEGSWTVTKHVSGHNHDLCDQTQSHLLRSQRNMTKQDLNYLIELKSSGIPVAAGIRVLTSQAGGASNLGFTSRDVYNNLALARGEELHGGDANKLMEIFKHRKETEADFYYDFELDVDCRLRGFFWRDGQMRKDYDLFGDLVVHDTTYRTNKYDLICGPFVGMNHHGQNIMFGCGFLVNERSESFVWLFETFLRSMGGKQPITIMTDQAAAMAAGIRLVFPQSRHRLCIWHIGENAKSNIKGLMKRADFSKMFHFLLKRTESIAEFEFYWSSMMHTYSCHKNTWLLKLYELRNKWCPAFNKDVFSGGILSSQRSETTNKSVSQRLTKTSTLCEFYNIFVNVIGEWRNNEMEENCRCNEGQPDMAIPNCNLLVHATQVYTIKAYAIFEEQFLAAIGMQHSMFSSNIDVLTYHTWKTDKDIIRNQVVYDKGSVSVECTCKMFTEVGILCCHCLRVMIVECFDCIPEKYIHKRWVKHGENMTVSNACSAADVDRNPGSSIWRSQTVRKFGDLIAACEENIKARDIMDAAFKKVRDSIVAEIGPIYIDECEEDVTKSGKLRDPAGKRTKGERNYRKKSLLDKKFNISRGKKRMALDANTKNDDAVRSSLRQAMGELAGNLVHPISSEGLRSVSPRCGK